MRTQGSRYAVITAIVIAMAALFQDAPVRSQSAWTSFAGQATDVGVGADGSVWVIGADPAASPDKSIRRWTPGGFTTVPGAAVRIAVDPKGVPWVVNSSGSVFRWTGSAWEQMPGLAVDIGIGANGAVWVVGRDGAPHNWTGSAWTRIEGRATAISVDPGGIPWIVGPANEIMRRNGAGWERMPGAARDIGIGADGTVFVVGTGAVTGGFQIYRLAGADWAPEPGAAGVRVAAGRSGIAYVVRDTASGAGMLVRSSTQISTPITVTVPATISIPATPSQPAPQPSQPGSVTSGTLVVGQPQVGQSSQPIVVQGLAAPYDPGSLPSGSLICPIIETTNTFGAGRKLVKGCASYGARAIMLGKAPSTSCPSGSFFDPQNGGECWSCPNGYIRNVSPVTSADACWKAMSEDLQSATRVGATGCASGQFSDPRNGGECWSCPSGYNRTWDPVTATSACSQSWVGPFSRATYHGKVRTCTGDSFFDPLDGGTCWTCPAGYRRTANPVTGNAACAKTIPTQYATATLVSGCATLPAAYGFGLPFRDPRNGGECWACPLMLKRSVFPVDTAGGQGQGEACILGGDTDGILWQSPQYPEPGVFAFSEGLVEMAFRNPKVVDAFLDKRAGGDAQKKRALWQQMQSTPGDSPEFHALVFAAMVTVARQPTPDMRARGSLQAFEGYIRARRMFVAQDARNMYDAWLGVDDYNKWQATRRASGHVGIDVGVLGGVPADYKAVAWAAASPDRRGTDFLDAVGVLGTLGSTTVTQARDSADAGFELSYLAPLNMALDQGLDKFDEVAGAFAKYGPSSIVGQAGKSMQAVGRGVFIGLTVVRAAVDLGSAISTLVAQEEAARMYADFQAEAQKPVSLRQMLDAASAEEKQLPLLFWSLAVGPYNAGRVAGQAPLSHVNLCGGASRSQFACQSAMTVVSGAARQLGM